jgi:hypothetical protein
MAMRRIGQVRGSRPAGQLDKALLIGLGLLLVLLMQATPFAGQRSAAGSGSSAAAAATPARAGLPTAAPLEAVSPAPGPEDAPASTEGPRPSLADPPTYRVEAGGAGANMRSRPSTSADIVLRLRDGAVVSNLDQRQTADGVTWQRVAEGSNEGWVAAELLVPGS